MSTFVSRLKVGRRLFLLQALMLAFIVFTGISGLIGMASTLSSLEKMQRDLMVPVERLGTVRTALQGVNLELLRALQHEPGHELAALHDHPLSRHLDNAQAQLQRMQQEWSAFRAVELDGAEPQRLSAAFDADLPRITAVATAAIATLRGGDYSSAALRPFIVEGQALMMARAGELDQLAELQLAEGRRMAAAAEAYYGVERWRLLALVVVAAGLSLALGVVVTRSITAPLERAVGFAESVAAGRLDAQHALDGGGDELGRLGAALNAMRNDLREVIGDLQRATEQLSSSASQLTTTSDQVSNASGLQSEAASSMAASIEEVTVSINHVADSAREAARLAQEAGEQSASGSQVVNQAVDAMRGVAASIGSATTAMEALRTRASDISRVVGVIREVADQTNLLALNAAIEAARAGEQGRGFAVVADEVRKLAERTAGSTTEITQSIEAIQHEVANAFGVMEQSARNAGTGVEVANQAGEAITVIAERAHSVDAVVADISNALHEQGAAANDIARNVEQIAEMATQNVNMVQQAAAASHRLHGLAQEISVLLQRFRM